MYYRVIPSLRDVPIPDHHEYGYEDWWDFQKALRRLTLTYGDRVGECIGTRHAFFLLRFCDPFTGLHSKEWLPRFLCVQAPPPIEEDDENEPDPLAGIFGEGW